MTRCVSGSAITPLLFRWKSPMLRVIARRPLTLAWPTLFQVTKPPQLWILSADTPTSTRQLQITVALRDSGDIRLSGEGEKRGDAARHTALM